MNHCVPEFDMDDDYAIPTSSSSTTATASFNATVRPNKKPAIGEEGIMELLWQNGQVVLQSQNQRSLSKKSPDADDQQLHQSTGASSHEIPSILGNHDNLSPPPPPPQQQQHQLFMQEDEMSSWLHYPLDDSSFDRDDLYSDLLYPPPPSAPPVTTPTPSALPREIRTHIVAIRQPPVVMPPRPPVPPPSRRIDPIIEAAAPPRVQNFMHFSRLPKSARNEPGPSGYTRELSTVVDSNETPTAAVPESRTSEGDAAGCRTMSCTPAAAPARESTTTACELTITSSPGGSGGSVSGSAEPQRPPSIHNPSTSFGAEDRKRKGREAEETDCHSEDIEFESADGKRQARGSTCSTKRSRAAEVHNLSERRRRDRINEKMKALQELIPRCNKSDKASMLDEAIEYLKSLQLQVQMMSMGCGMLPMMYPGVQQFMPAMGMGMGMGIDMGMNRPMIPYPTILPGSGMPSPAVAANMGPRFPMPAFHMQPVPVPESSRIQVSNQLDPMLNSLVAPNPNHPRIPNFVDPFQQFIGHHQAQIPLPQNQAVVPPSKPNSRETENPDNHQAG